MPRNSDKRIANAVIRFSDAIGYSNGQINILVRSLRPIVDSIVKNKNNRKKGDDMKNDESG